MPSSLLACITVIRTVSGRMALRKSIEIDQSVAGNGKVRDGNALLFQRLAGVEDGFMFDSGGNDVRGR